jgi:hypothetical protein
MSALESAPLLVGENDGEWRKQLSARKHRHPRLLGVHQGRARHPPFLCSDRLMKNVGGGGGVLAEEAFRIAPWIFHALATVAERWKEGVEGRGDARRRDGIAVTYPV